ncbi:hypothetical protein IQ247_27725 [Plectonema cf. radiosum LEGE 06105]|uniref:Uncharacterized protein n=1 Tax=Plectonema cf. radiosum LEGE 06105 TaxID=945769 RepID=A0A8J7F891_9CYAN|nr:hypothetical protein [Plectonema radiosum]MBE9216407.1 hypothetical protein [Plectonema cf. radiosum LEGE 06105]
MSSFTVKSNGDLKGDTDIWNNLKQAIAISSGFQRWQLEQVQSGSQIEQLGLDEQVQRYLRETLENLAY